MSKLQSHEPTRAHFDKGEPDAVEPEAAAPMATERDVAALAAAERRARERLTKLQAITAALSEAILPVDVAHVVANEMAAVLGASQAVLAVPLEDGTRLRLLGSSGLGPERSTRYATFPVDGDFPITSAFRTGRAAWLGSRAELLQRHPNLPDQHEIRAEASVCVPLAVKGVALGALGFGFAEPRVFDLAERALIQDLARHAALALERARLYEAEQTARRQAELAGAETEALLRLAQAAASANDLDAIYRVALDAMLELLRADRASISLFDAGGTSRLAAWRSLSDEHCQAMDAHAPWAPGDASPRPLMVSDVTGDPDLATFAPLFEDQNIHALVCAPLAYEAELLGTFMVYFARPRAFSSHDEQLALAVASQTAQAVARARLLVRERQARERATFMAEASRVLATTLDVQATLRDVAQLAVPAMADWSAVELAVEDGPGKSKRVAVVHVDPDKVALAHRLNQQYPPDPNAPRGVPHVLRTGVSELYEAIPDELLVQAARDAEHLRIARALGLRSAMTVAIRFQDRILGTISFVAAESGRQYTRSDLEMAEELGRRAGLALENARLYEAEREAREAAVVARQQAEAASQAREEILAVVSHDLRNPLNAILMSANSLQTLQIPDKPGQRVRTAAERIERACERMARLIGDLVDFASVQSGQLAIQKSATRPVEILDAAFEMFAGPAEERGVQLERQLHGMPAAVDCDRDRVVQALANLMANAIKVTAAGGRVIVGAERRGPDMVFFVRDTGPGIAADELPQVFERYWRSKKVAYKGSGLGLTIVKGIVDAHGGRIWIESVLDAGSTFYFSLPAAPESGS
jgi:signal transduction histidine kinase